MLRRDFLKRFGIGAAAVVAAPSIIKAVEPIPPPTGKLEGRWDPERAGAWEQMREENIRPHYAQYPYTTDQCYESNIDEYLRRKEMEKYWPELVKRYGKSMSITDFLSIT